jgi:hypothetical protein
MNQKEIRLMQEKVGTLPDGIWGPKSKAAIRSYLLSKAPSNVFWPEPSQSKLKAFYGDPWNNKDIVSIDAPEWMTLYNSKRKVEKISCHKKVANSLLKALHEAYEKAPKFVSRYYGCHVDRSVRGGNSPSLHAYGAAIDLSAATNRLRQKWPESADMPLSVMEAFAKQGWMPAGAAWGRDAMHFQATQW